MLWQRLRNQQLSGLKFRRQHPLGPFIADFYCAACRLVMEIDGDIHDLQPERDAARTEQFEQYGYRVIRFRNKQVLNDVEDVLTHRFPWRLSWPVKLASILSLRGAQRRSNPRLAEGDCFASLAMTGCNTCQFHAVREIRVTAIEAACTVDSEEKS
jgi:hypothetical protein